MDQKRRGSPPSQQIRQNVPWASSRHPLIDFAKNDWRTNPRYDQPEDLPKWSQWAAMLRFHRFRRYIVMYLLLIVACWLSWRWWWRDQWLEDADLKHSLDNVSSTGRYGVNVRPTFANMVQMKELDRELVPTTGKQRPTSNGGERRLIVVGDVHGCKDELLKLLNKISFDPASDHLVLTGDLVKKGPDSIGVINFVRGLGASCVRGNHEDRVLLAYQDLHAKHLPLPGPMEDPHTEDDDLDEESFSHGDYQDRKLAKRLDHEQAKWLQDCPVILKVGSIEGMGEVVIVHAGLVPGVDLDNQDPFNVMNMRTMDRDTLFPSSRKKGLAWSKLWKLYQQRLPPKYRMTVIYGHDSHRGLSIYPYSKGLDTGCVRGGKLTALVIEGGAKKAKQKFVSVKCKDHRLKSNKEDDADD
ncbi:hypothetical protein FGG08_001281 [Glutinoglossum americanum]|uniref:Calcineurin-like phosphoesterase domain-containing protein n=1 Tax=Glutinoglossum americanum TaxID=1670608 RepID=A0A9P8L2Z1_9PEZI|nr:hypothetical protein FGG08_001281 [Glutinoglossum americanum]